MGLFGKKTKNTTAESNGTNIAKAKNKEPDIRFGRFTDINKSDEQVNHWKECMKLHKEGQYLDSIKHFLDYLCDKTQNNLTWKDEEGKIQFEFFQGSKLIKGYANNDEFVAESFIASFDKASVPVMRKLMTLNYSLKYSWFAIKDNLLCMRFTADARNASPYQIYDALKELSTEVDRQDDILIDEFDSLKPVENAPIIEITDQEKEIKFRYYQKWLDEALEKVKRMDEEKDSGAISYIFLTLTYKLDFLLSPEGVLTNTLEKIHGIYFKKLPQGQQPNYIELNRTLLDEYEKLKAIPKEDIYKSFYRTRATFTVLQYGDYKKIADFVFNEAKNTNYYYNKRLDDMVINIYQYIASYSLFIYDMFTPLIRLMRLYLHITENEYFKELGFSQNYMQSGKLNKYDIEKELDDIVREARIKYPNFTYAKNMLKYDSVLNFSITFFKEFDFLNFTK